MRLEAKLALLGIGTALLAVILVAFISRRSTVFLVDRRVAEDVRQSAATALDDVERWRRANGSWDGAGPKLAAVAAASSQDLLLLDESGRCVASAPAHFCNETIVRGPGDRLVVRSVSPGRLEERDFIGVPHRLLPGRTQSDPSWMLYAMLSEPPRAIPTRRFFDSLGTSLWLGSAIAAFVAILLSVFVARTLVRPIRGLIDAAQSMQSGDLSRRVAVGGGGEMSELGKAFNSMAEGLAKQDRLRKDMLHDVAHELRGPLTNMRCHLEAVQDGLVAMNGSTVVSLHDDVMQLSRLIDDLRDIALAEAGQLQMSIERCDLVALAERVTAAMQPSAQARGVRLTLDTPARATVRADAGRCAQVLANLISNAIRHSPAPGEVRVRIAERMPWVSIEVEDEGPGIAPEHRPFVFDRFYRTDASRARESGGVGLGLAIVKQLTELQEGTVEVTSSGLGARFTVRLPRAGGNVA
jgi:signal transduction histidine kinase